MSQNPVVYCQEKCTKLFQIRQCEEGEEKGRPEQLPLVRGPETTFFPPPTMHRHLPGVIWPLCILFPPGPEMACAASVCQFKQLRRYYLSHKNAESSVHLSTVK